MGDNLENFAINTSAKKKLGKRSSLEEEEFFNLLHGSDPVKIELNRLQNEVKEKDRELAEALNEIKGLSSTERAKDKALTEVREELEKVIEKLDASEAALENKNLEIKKISEEKKEALAAQFAAEATVRRVHAAQKDEELPPLELAPLEAEIKLLKHMLSKLQDDNKALERLMKTKEAALLEAEKEVQSANLKAALVDDLLNKNQDLTKQNEICQEEYKILDNMHRQKVAEVEKIGQTVRELEEAVLSGAKAANAARDYQRQVSELKDEIKTLKRTLSRAMVTESRIAAATANEWKDANDKVIPVKQWLEERRIILGEMQLLRDKLSAAERATRAEAQLKERYLFRLKVVEDGLKSSLKSGINCENRSNAVFSRSRSVNGVDVSPNPSTPSRKSSSISSKSPSMLLKHAKGASRSYDGGSTSPGDRCKTKLYGDTYRNDGKLLRDDVEEATSTSNISTNVEDNAENQRIEHGDALRDDYVSGVLYDVLQKEVVALRKACLEKEQCIKDKDNSIEVLAKKVDTLSNAMEVERRKLRREKAVLEKELASSHVEKESDKKSRSFRGMMNLHN